MAMGIRQGIFAIAFVLSVAGVSVQISGYDVAKEATLGSILLAQRP
jgi:hypothetical protein